jgi:hypothetical protein
LCQDVKAVHYRQHNIEQNEVVFPLLGAQQSAATVVNSVQLEVMRRKKFRQQPTQLDIVINEKKGTHGKQSTAPYQDAAPTIVFS